LRASLTQEGARIAMGLSDLGERYTPVSAILDEKAYVNGIVGLMATGGSTNLLIHLIAMARASGVLLDWEDFAEISQIVPLLTRIYPNGLADVNHFHAAGGLGLVISELLNAGLLHDDTATVVGIGLERYTQEPKLVDGALVWQGGVTASLNDKIIAQVKAPFLASGGLTNLSGNLGQGVMKTSAVRVDRQVITAPVRVFHTQEAVLGAFRAGEFTSDVVVVVRYQGPKANGMPELHGLTPCLAVLQDRGIKVALVSDGRMSGASGKVPAAIHVCPEALDGGPLAYLRDGDIVTVDAVAGVLAAQDVDIFKRALVHPDLSGNETGLGREFFGVFRNCIGAARDGASVFAL
jgi:phosphogluconate dehydratase